MLRQSRYKGFMLSNRRDMSSLSVFHSEVYKEIEAFLNVSSCVQSQCLRCSSF